MLYREITIRPYEQKRPYPEQPRVFPSRLETVKALEVLGLRQEAAAEHALWEQEKIANAEARKEFTAAARLAADEWHRHRAAEKRERDRIWASLPDTEKEDECFSCGARVPYANEEFMVRGMNGRSIVRACGSCSVSLSENGHVFSPRTEMAYSLVG